MNRRPTSQSAGDDSAGAGTLRSVSRVLKLLLTFSTERPELTLDELSNELQISKASLLRLLRSLVEEGFLRRTGDTYRLGARVLDLSNVFLSSLSFVEVARPEMEKLATECRQTVNLAVLEGAEIVYVAIAPFRRDVGIQYEIGGRHPVHATALGKVLLADLEESDVRNRLGKGPLPRLTHRTIADANTLVAHLEQVREDGYAVDDEERGIGIRCIAAPIRSHEGKAIAAVSIAAPIFHLTDDRFPEFVTQLLTAAGRVSRELGFRAATSTGA